MHFPWNYASHVLPSHMARFCPAGKCSTVGWQVARNDWSRWVARRLAVGIKYSDICWQAYSHTHAQLTRLSPDPLGRCCRRFPSFRKGESENCHFTGLVTVSFLTNFLGRDSHRCTVAVTLSFLCRISQQMSNSLQRGGRSNVPMTLKKCCLKCWYENQHV